MPSSGAILGPRFFDKFGATFYQPGTSNARGFIMTQRYYLFVAIILISGRKKLDHNISNVLCKYYIISGLIRAMHLTIKNILFQIFWFDNSPSYQFTFV